MANNEDNKETKMAFIPHGDSQPTPEEEEKRAGNYRCLDLITRGIRGLRWLLQHKLTRVFFELALLIIIVVLGILYGRSRHHTSCPTNWHQYNEKCFYFSKEEKNWNSSESFCNQFRASLVTINTEFQEFMDAFKVKYIYWIGLRRDADKLWKWRNGEIYTMKVIGEDGGNCTYLSDKFKPSTSRCSSEHHWICSKAAMKNGKNR